MPVRRAQITFCSSHLPRTKRTKKHRERNAQSRYMPIQIASRPPWKASTEPDVRMNPEDPQLRPVQDARTDTPDSSVLPANHTNPAVQDAHALPQTGTSLFAALAMALGGFALTIAGAWASLLGKNSRH